MGPGPGGGLATLPPNRPAPALSPSLRGGRGRPGFKSQALSRSVTKLRPCSLSERAAAPDSVPRAARHSSWCQHLGTVLRAVVLPRSTHSLAAGSRILPATRSANPGRRLRRRPKKDFGKSQKLLASFDVFCEIQVPRPDARAADASACRSCWIDDVRGVSQTRCPSELRLGPRIAGFVSTSRLFDSRC